MEPKHWKEPFPEDPAIEIRSLAVGQAVQLREWMRRVGRDASHNWPEYADAGLHRVPSQLSRRQRIAGGRGAAMPGRKPGDPAWNTSRFAVLEPIAHLLDAANARRSGSRTWGGSIELVSDMQADRAQIAAAAIEAANSADKLAHNLATMKLDPGVLEADRSICADADRIANQGERAAEQAAMAVNSLYVAYLQGRKPAERCEDSTQPSASCTSNLKIHRHTIRSHMHAACGR